MPFTPFHFGPGLLIKGLLPRSFSWTAFAAAQVAIDCETLYHMIQRHYPVHREMHTLVGATMAGVGTAAGLLILRRMFHEMPRPSLRAESSTAGIMLGGVVGGASHPFLDGLMHPDVQPFLPWRAGNPLLDKVDSGTLHLACLAAGAIGLLLMIFHLYRERRAARSRPA